MLVNISRRLDKYDWEEIIIEHFSVLEIANVLIMLRGYTLSGSKRNFLHLKKAFYSYCYFTILNNN